MKVLLVSAATPDTFWSYRHVLSFVSKKAAFPPLGLMTVAAMLPRDWELRLADLNVRRLTDRDLDWADYVLLSAMIVQLDSAREVVRRARARGKPVIGGGPLFTTGRDRIPEVEHVVVGEAERVISQLVDDMKAGRVRAEYATIERPDLAETPPPRWDLIDLRHYAMMSVQYSRGCPFNCEFCDIIEVNGRVPRVKAPEQMIRELDDLIEAGWRGPVFVVDDNFIGNKVKVKRFLRRLVEWREQRRPDMTFVTEASVNLADDAELLDLMPRAGFRKVFVGIETPEEAGLLECAKVQNTRRDLIAAVRKIQNSGMEVMAGFIIGFDSDSPLIFEHQRRFIEESGIVQAMVGLLMALPGTQLFRRLSREGRILDHATGNNVASFLNFVPKLDRDLLIQGYRSLVKHLYAPESYYSRILAFLREYRPNGPRSRNGWQDVKALLKSFWVMGVWTEGRREYWKFVTRVILEHRRKFSEAMTLAIMGYHFRRVAAAL